MHESAPPAPSSSRLNAERVFLAVLILVLIARLVGLMVTPLGLHPDEAQYWSWSRDLAFGYYSKPPMVAWLIATTTAPFGDPTWAVRLSAPFLHTLTAWLLFLLGRRLYSSEVGALAGIAWLFIPSVWLSSMLASTDAALLPMWALALWAFHRLCTNPRWDAAIWLGVALGLGALAKYAMLYFPLCALLAAVWWKPARQGLVSKYMAVAGAVGLAILAPNLIWNAAHDFATVGHTVANANIAGNEELGNLDEAGGFFVDQLGMAGLWTVTFAVALVLMVRRWSEVSPADRFLLAFILPPLLIILAQSFVSRAHANWAASAYPALVVLATAFLAAPGRRGWLVAAMTTHVAGWVLFLTLVIAPPLADTLGLSNALKRLRGWGETAAAVEARYDAGAYQTILVDHRHLFFELMYLWRDRPDLQAKLRMWLLRGDPHNHAELTAPMTPGAPSPALTVQMSPHYTRFLAADFQRFTPLDQFDAPIGGKRVRAIVFGVGETFTPQPRTQALLEAIGR